jgi:hypothetical protein
LVLHAGRATLNVVIDTVPSVEIAELRRIVADTTEPEYYFVATA